MGGPAAPAAVAVWALSRIEEGMDKANRNIVSVHWQAQAQAQAREFVAAAVAAVAAVVGRLLLIVYLAIPTLQGVGEEHRRLQERATA